MGKITIKFGMVDMAYSAITESIDKPSRLCASNEQPLIRQALKICSFYVRQTHVGSSTKWAHNEADVSFKSIESLKARFGAPPQSWKTRTTRSTTIDEHDRMKKSAPPKQPREKASTEECIHQMKNNTHHTLDGSIMFVWRSANNCHTISNSPALQRSHRSHQTFITTPIRIRVSI